MQPTDFDLLIRGGTVLDPASPGRRVADVGIRAGRIAAVASSLPGAAAQIIDATGKFVTPGLVDFHVHVYWGGTVFGVEADKAGAASGTTTFLDTGSAGATNFPAFRRYVIDPARTRIRALVHICTSGLVTGLGELRDPRYLDVAGAVDTVAENPGVVVGVKIRYTDIVVGAGAQAKAALAAALEAAAEAGVWLMVHVGRTPEPLDAVLEKLRPGDVITHSYSARSGALMHHQTRALASRAREARARGILFDIGHGQGSFGWDAARAALDAGFPPDTISTDLHRGNIDGTVFDFPTTMTKFWYLGMDLEDIVRRCTLAPARKLGLEVGRLTPGAEADVAVLEVVEGPVTLTDAEKVSVTWDRRLRAAVTIRAGRILDPTTLGAQTPVPVPLVSIFTGEVRTRRRLASM
ncbi:MAG: amidohydrolase/deacetylase family metallohydrolase [Actinobacteria bacterium]|nr:amidohydrolase/deacetylase family metallohydrolase [Actinomycetota bacterium]